MGGEQPIHDTEPAGTLHRYTRHRDVGGWGDVRIPNSFHELHEARGNVMEVHPAPEADILLLVTEGEVLAFDSNGLRWCTPRLSADGIRIDECRADVIRGTADYDWNPVLFTIDVASGRVKDGNPFA